MHPTLENRTRFAFAPLFVADETARPLLVLVAKATYDLGTGGAVTLAEEQLPVSHEGEYTGAPGESSYKYEPEIAWPKPGTDLVLVGHAWAPARGVNTLDVSFLVGQVQQVARVFGERIWERSVLGTRFTAPLAFESIPLTYENAFGGWDRSPADPAKHSFEPRNPVGRGFRVKESRFEEGERLPSIEHPLRLIRSFHDRPEPVGFGFTCAHWQPRARFAGTYDEAWARERQPLLPEDFDRRFFQAASPGLCVAGRLTGRELVRGVNVSKAGQLAFYLPGQPPPVCRVAFRAGPDACVATELDTVVVNADENKLLLLWRAQVVLDEGPHDVTAIEIEAEGAGASEPHRPSSRGS